MFKLIPYELQKILRRKNFPAVILLLLLINVFMLWYLNAPDEVEPPLSSYKAVYNDIKDMDSHMQIEYLSGLLDTINSVKIVEMISVLSVQDNEYAPAAAQNLLEEMGDEFEEYKQLYDSGDYLSYTDSIYREEALLSEILDECGAVSDYDGYIDSIEKNRNMLGGISIFNNNAAEDSFSSRNIEKSYEDHKNLTSENIKFVPSRGIKIAAECLVTDVILLLSVVMFVGFLIGEEKEKRLFSITRATKNGIAKCIGAKIASLMIFSVGISTLMYGSNFLYACFTAGVGDISAAVQSIYTFTESSLEITIGQFFLLGIIIKSVGIFGFGLLLSAIYIFCTNSIMPPLIGIGALAAFRAAYQFIPAYSAFAPVKYLTFWGAFSTPQMLGEYLNFNIFGRPVGRLFLMVIVTIFTAAALVFANLFLFMKRGNLENRRINLRPGFQKVHGNLFFHEGGKILFMNRALAVLLLFGILIGYGEANRRYFLSSGETYYSGFLDGIEGELNADSERKILDEKARYDYAFEQISLIEEMINSGEIDERLGEDMKSAWQAQTVFYPYFTRVWQQYEHILEYGGEIIYDTGYRKLFGYGDDSFLNDCLMVSICIVFAFSGVMSMENRTQSWNLISATSRGKSAVIRAKTLFCAVCAAVVMAIQWIFRFGAVSGGYHLAMWGASANNLPMYYGSALGIPIWLFAAMMIVTQFITIVIVAFVTLFISYKLKNGTQTIVTALLLFAVPLILSVMGLDFMKNFSIYPIYSFGFL